MSVLKQFASTLKDRLGYDPKEVELISADAVNADLIADLRTVFGSDVVIHQTIDPQVVGGVKIKVGDLLLDASLEQQLEELQQALAALDTSKSESKDNIAQQLKAEVMRFNGQAEISEVGRVVEVKDGICRISGLTHCMNQEMLEFSNGTKALAFDLQREEVGAIVMGGFRDIKVGDLVKRTHKVMSIGVGEELIGRVVDALGNAVDGKPAPKSKTSLPIEKVAPGVIARKRVSKPLQTGIKAIDALIPIGRGQRELILGDRQTGKTTIAVDTILNQKNENVICIYVAIGQKESKIAKLVSKLRAAGAMDYTIVVKASAAEAAPMLFLAPYSGVTIAEYFADQGKDVLVVYDDLSKHAVAYREMSLLLRRPPGREAYPGDVFYLHSRLLERACNLNEEHGGGSITALPIVETQAGDISAYIPTNVISITDGQIFLETGLFFRGTRPAINVGLSVSRVGGDAQIKPMKKVAGSIKLALAQFRELEAFSQFSSDLDAKTKQQLERGRRVSEVLKQKNFSPLAVEKQILSIFAVSNGYFDEVALADISRLESELVEYALDTNGELLRQVKSGAWDSTVEEGLHEVCKQYLASIKSEA